MIDVLLACLPGLLALTGYVAAVVCERARERREAAERERRRAARERAERLRSLHRRAQRRYTDTLDADALKERTP